MKLSEMPGHQLEHGMRVRHIATRMEGNVVYIARLYGDDQLEILWDDGRRTLPLLLSGCDHIELLSESKEQ
jgi:hypothetical protein